MPRLANMQDYNFGNFVFTGTRPENLTEAEYTVVNILTDMTGSVEDFADQLLQMEKQIVQDAKGTKAKPSAYGKKLVIRLNRFNSSNNSANNSEVYGFRQVSDIDIDADHQPFHPTGGTPLIDSTFDGVNAVLNYCKDLRQNDFTVNGLVVVITDGDENSSRRATLPQLKKLITEAVKTEALDSFKAILVGVNTSNCGAFLQKFQADAGFDQYVDAGDVKDGTIGKLAKFISQSISSTSQALGTGSPSQNLTI